MAAEICARVLTLQGFYLGRFDYKFSTEERLMAGNVMVMEVNQGIPIGAWV